MQMTFVKYRTSLSQASHNEYAVVPTCWLSDLIDWLTLSEETEILATDNNPTFADPILPIGWPSYRACSDAMRISDLLDPIRF